MYTVYFFRIGQNHTSIGIYGVHAVFLAGKSPYRRSYTVQIYGSGQPRMYLVLANPRGMQWNRKSRGMQPVP